MRYRINLENGLSEPYDEFQLVMLYQAGAISKDSRVKEDTQDADWTTLGSALPFISSVQATGYIAGRLSAGIAAEKLCIVQRVELPFWNIVFLVFKVIVAAVPIFFFLSLIAAYITQFFGGPLPVLR